MIIGVGCDIVAISRFEEKRDAFARKILTTPEKDLYKTIHPSLRLQWLAGRFAAKEAIVKALDYETTINQIGVLSTPQGKPICVLEGYTVHISISHEREYAIAYAMVEKP